MAPPHSRETTRKTREDIKQCKTDIEQLKAELQQMFEEDAEAFYLPDAATAASIPPCKTKLIARRCLKGHFGKIYALHWAKTPSERLVSASQDGRLIIWNSQTSNKLASVNLRSSWVMTCAYSPSGRFVACGGLDNICSVYKADPEADEYAVQDKPHKPKTELAFHEGYLSCCRFLDDGHMITSSGDSNCIMWDVEQKKPTVCFDEHIADVMSVSPDSKGNTFVSGSVDITAKLFDIREAHCVGTFHGHESDINAVQMLPNDHSFVTGSDDSACSLFDARCLRQLNLYHSESVMAGVSSVAVSASGKYLVAAYSGLETVVWDTDHGSVAQAIRGHELTVSSVGFSSDGNALATGSWDQTVAIWA